MNPHTAPHKPTAPTGSAWGVLGRWLLLLLITFDLVSAPFHRHSHDLGVAGIGMPLPHAAAGAGVSLPGLSSGPASSRALDDPLVLDAVPAAGFSHSQALLRTAESRDGTPSLLAFDLGLALWVWAWAPSDSTRGWPRPGGSAGSARRPPGLLPEGRAPPRPLA